MHGTSASSGWYYMLRKIMRDGEVTHPRKFTCREILGNLTVFDMARPVNLVVPRRLGYRFMCAEAAWILSGDNRVATIEPYSKGISCFSDDGIFFYGAYGPKIIDQLSYVLRKLVEDRDTRQAVLTIWRESPPETRDPPCSVAVQFQIRHNQLHCLLFIRSSDAWLGVPYDVFNFSMLSGTICLLYRQRTGETLGLGQLYFYAGNQHLYDKNFKEVEEVLMVPAEHLEQVFEPNSFASSQDLIDHLWDLANKRFAACKYHFLTSFMGEHYVAKT